MLLSLRIDQPYHRFVKRLQAFKFELRTHGAQRQHMRCFAGSCRFVYNKGLALQKARFDAGETKLNYAGLCKLLTQWRSETQTSWLKDAPTHPHAIALRKGQQAMCRKQKFSHNWNKARGRIQRIHARIGHARHDYLHKASTAISQNHAMVCLEDLQVRNMSRSAAGSIEAPGKQVRAKAGLNRSILDQGWFEFRRQLQYKLSWNGGELILVPPQNTSRRCPQCDHVSAQNRRTQERFACIECGFEDHADQVGAINILRAGHARCACEVSGALRSPAAGTRRSDSGAAQCSLKNAVGILRLPAREDVNIGSGTDGPAVSGTRPAPA